MTDYRFSAACPRRPAPVWFHHLEDLLRRSGVRFVGAVIGERWGAFVEFHGATWCLCDNGGEVQVDRVNSPADSGIGYVSWGMLVAPATAAHRVMQRLNGVPVDFAFSVSEDDNAVLLGAAGAPFPALAGTPHAPPLSADALHTLVPVNTGAEFRIPRASGARDLRCPADGECAEHCGELGYCMYARRTGG